MIGFIYIFSSFFIPLINLNFNRRTAIQNVITSSLYNPKYGGDNE